MDVRLKSFEFHRDSHGVMYLGDCREIMPLLNPDDVDLIITDPPWPGHKIDVSSDGDPEKLFRQAAAHFLPLADRVIIMLGLTTDPRILRHIPDELPFVKSCWLERVPPQYRGPLLYDADKAYVFGHKKLPRPGKCKVLPSKCIHASRGFRVGGNPHPCPRPQTHVNWLVAWYSSEGQTILDPFAGSGTLAYAAKRANRRYILIDTEKEYLEFAKQQQVAQGQIDLG